MITFPLEISPAGDTKNPTQSAISLGRIARPGGICATAFAKVSALKTPNKGVSVIAGAIELTAILSVAYRRAKSLVSVSKAAFEAR
jgi:hypothetical protein